MNDIYPQWGETALVLYESCSVTLSLAAMSKVFLINNCEV